MKRKLFCELSPLTYRISMEKEILKRHVKDLFPREIMQTYVVVNYIAGVLRENIDFAEIDALFAEYGFDLNQYVVL